MKIFISYARADVEWAAKLKASLPQYEFFFDQADLRAGEGWETRILHELTECDHLIVLWSTQAKGSGWVQREAGHFDGKRHRAGGMKPDSGKLLLHVLLDDEPLSAYASEQAVTVLRDAKAYGRPAAEVSADAWDKAVSKIREALQNPGLPVSLAVLTLTRPYVTGEGLSPQEKTRCVDFDFVPAGGKSLSDLMAAMKLTRSQLADFYGAERTQWRPFGGRQTVGDILISLKQQLNSSPKAEPIRWFPVDDDLLSDDEKRIQSAQDHLATGLALVVFDPVALYSQWIRNYIQNLEGCLSNPHAIVAVLPIFPQPDEPRMTHTRMIRQVFARLVDHFYEELPSVEHARCSIFTAEDADIRRMVRSTLRDLSSEHREGPAATFTRMGRR